MQFRDFLVADKTISSPGVWSNKKMPRTGGKFPLSKNHSFRLGTNWRWRVVDLTAGTSDFRLLIAYHEHKQQYLAALGVSNLSDTLVLARLEYHGTHPGWHLHAYCNGSEQRHWGRMSYPEMVRLPSGKKRHRRMDFSINDSDALDLATKFFRIDGLKPEPAKPGNLELWPK